MVVTAPSRLGAHAEGAPVRVSSSAIRVRGTPPTIVNPPPANTAPPWIERDHTMLFAFGFHGSSAPVVRSIAARRLRFASSVLKVVNRPAVIRVEPSLAIAY